MPGRAGGSRGSAPSTPYLNEARPAGAATPTRVRGGGAGFGVKEPGINPAGGAIPRRGGPLGHRAGERGLYHHVSPNK
jgi:hypothetical protein